MDARIKFLVGEWEKANHNHEKIGDEIDRVIGDNPAVSWLIFALEKYAIERSDCMKELARYGIGTEEKALQVFVYFENLEQQKEQAAG